MRGLRSIKLGCAILAASLLGSSAGWAASWFPLGPYGGDARSFAVDPADSRHLFLGTATGWVYDSHDGGSQWTRVAQIANRNDLVIDHIVVDKRNPRRLVVGTRTVEHPGDGGLFISEDYGETWYSQAEMRGQAVLSLARSGDDKELVAGTLKGVYRSLDNGVHWQQISPLGSTEIHEVQSIAIDPADDNVIYAGTWHLPWKTTDGGATWKNIKEGVIDDSDVFSIIVDPKQPNIVYASACSGIYKSNNGGNLFHKVQGIPSTARRTRKLEQDPEHPETVFAGTTEGLYRTLDSGAQWERMTPTDVIVNDVYVDPRDVKHVLIATDRGGVFRSEDGGTTFEASNAGFSARQVIAFASDAQHPGKLYVGVVNDKATGGVFESTDGAVHWQQQSEGLGGRDVFSLVSLTDGTLLAGTAHGIFRLQDGNWADSSLFEGPSETKNKAANAPRIALPSAQPKIMAVRAGSSVRAPKHPYAATRTSPSRHNVRATLPSKKAHGKLAKTAGHKPSSHKGGKLLRVSDLRRKPSVVAPARPSLQVKATPAKPAKPNRVDSGVYSMVRAGNVLFAATGTGLLRSGDGGQHWTMLSSLPLNDVHFLALEPTVADGVVPAEVKATGSGPFDPAPVPSTAAGEDNSAAPTLLVAALNQMMLSHDGGMSWNPVTLPGDLTQIGAVCIDGNHRLWVGGREGVWFSPDGGTSWKTLRNLFLRGVNNLYYDGVGHRVLVTGSNSSNAFSVQMADDKVTYWDTGWKLRFVRPVGDHLVGATLFDGIVVQPEMVDSATVAAGTTAK